MIPHAVCWLPETHPQQALYRGLKIKDKALLFRRKNIVESALYVKKKWGTLSGAQELWHGRKGCEGSGLGEPLAIKDLGIWSRVLISASS